MRRYNSLLQQPNHSFSIRYSLFCILCLYLFTIIMNDALAAAHGSGDPVGAALCKLVAYTQGNISRAIAMAAVIAIAIQTLRGQLKWEVAFVIATGIVIIFNAAWVVQMISGDTGSCV